MHVWFSDWISDRNGWSCDTLRVQFQAYLLHKFIWCVHKIKDITLHMLCDQRFISKYVDYNIIHLACWTVIDSFDHHCLHWRWMIVCVMDTWVTCAIPLWGRVTHIWLHKLTIIWTSAWILLIGNKLQWNFYPNSNIFIQENAFENVVCEMAPILSQPQSDTLTFNTSYFIDTFSFVVSGGTGWPPPVPQVTNDNYVSTMEIHPKQFCIYV